MSLFVLLASLMGAINETVTEKIETHRAIKERALYEKIEWDNIACVTFDGTETAYRIEEEEEFDIVSTYYLSEADGWPHYETKTVQYKVEDGENYCFTIRYKNCAEFKRKFHEDSELTQKLLKYAEKDYDISLCKDPLISRFYGIIKDSLALLETTLNPETYFSRYKLAIDNAKRILETTTISHYTEYASGIIEDLTQNKIENYKYFADRCYYRDRLDLVKDQLLSDNYDIPLEVKEYVKSLLVELEAENNADELEEYGGRFAVIDLETTGLNCNFNRQPADEIISVAIIDQDGKVLLDTYCDTVKIKQWDEAEHIHGISPKDVKGHPSFVEILPKVIEILSDYDYVIAYNVKFEKMFIQNYAYHYAREYLTQYFKIKWGDDPMEMFMNHMNSPIYLKLEKAAAHFGYKYKAHNALEDAKAALHVYNALRNKE